MEFSHPKGIYQQIADQIRERIAIGEWKEGERIPSVRDLAVTMGVNPNTVARSYQNLLEKMIIENRRGIGYFVTLDAQKRIIENMKEQFITVELLSLFEKMHKLGITMGELVEYHEEYIKGKQKGEKV